MPTLTQVNFAHELRHRLTQLSNKGLRQDAIIALAEVLQEELTVDPADRDEQQIPHYKGMEIVMRAIVSILDTNKRGRNGAYVSSTLRNGVRYLAQSLQVDLPSFAAAEATHDIPLSKIEA